MLDHRPLCCVCKTKPAAINYKKNGVTYFRKRCDNCIRKKKNIKPAVASWLRSGYVKKDRCERCGFKAKYKEQLGVFHLDGNLNNTIESNLKTLCCNCQVEVSLKHLKWRSGDITPDL